MDKPYSKWTPADYDHAEVSEQNAFDAWWLKEQERKEEKMYEDNHLEMAYEDRFIADTDND